MKLIDARRARRMSLPDLAEKAGIGTSTLILIENGTSKRLRMETIVKLEKALGVNGRMIDEFQEVLGEPDEFLRRITPSQLEADWASVELAEREAPISREEHLRRLSESLLVTA